ncbi:single-stranded DNA-binding protein [Brevibacterium sp. BRM-1]|uniref:single-stranded DNA-binding protein n=1 Tax=Brevibacterium sp. BRM-1 TaxID=2999062 RepID=UPI00227DCBE5|nr:single-stranded DNA-binding protein [Brevibacterium sp. BRM-1]WAL41108.1 single-stranded DNA-binding protein [Brevibacterium sp. BRM-1]
MAIHTQESVSGFVASDPQLTQTTKGDPRLYLRFGQEHYRREDDGSFTQLETTFHNLVMFGRSAEHADVRFAKGDNFVAEGYIRPVNYERDGQTVNDEEFVAKKIGHDLARTRYDVDRTPRRGSAEREAPERDASAFASERGAQRGVASAMGL